MNAAVGTEVAQLLLRGVEVPASIQAWGEPGG